MISGKKIKFAVFEILQFAVLCVPTIVVAERLASIVMRKSKPADLKSYQLILACSVAYVACVSLVIWVPVKFLMFKKRILSKVKEWQPTLLMHLIFTTLPCFGFIIAGSQMKEIKKDLDLHSTFHDHRTPQSALQPMKYFWSVAAVVMKGEMHVRAYVQHGLPLSQFKTFSDLPVSLVITCLIFVSITENLRKWRLTGKIDVNRRDDVFASNGPVLTNIEQISTVSAQQGRAHEENQTTAGVTENEIASSVAPRTSNKSRIVLQSSLPSTVIEYNTPEHKVPALLKFLAVNDNRAELFATSIISWLDTIELVRVAGLPNVVNTGWVYPIYIVSCLSLFRIVLDSANPFLPSLTVILQDFPFFFVRVSLIGVMGVVTPVLYPLKNIIVLTTYIYFNYVTKCQYFNRIGQF